MEGKIILLILPRFDIIEGIINSYCFSVRSYLHFIGGLCIARACLKNKSICAKWAFFSRTRRGFEGIRSAYGEKSQQSYAENKPFCAGFIFQTAPSLFTVWQT